MLNAVGNLLLFTKVRCLGNAASAALAAFGEELVKIVGDIGPIVLDTAKVRVGRPKWTVLRISIFAHLVISNVFSITTDSTRLSTTAQHVSWVGD